MNKTAIISEDKKYRYQLSRIWDDSKPNILFMMLNPSTADYNNDDPTIRRCIGYAKSWGYGGLYVGNLFAFRATKPKELLSCEHPVGSVNLIHITMMSAECEAVVCAWGNSKIVDKIFKQIKESYFPLKGLFDKMYYIDLCNDGTPKHPLYLKGDLLLKKYERPTACSLNL